ncbi:FTR1 family protein [Paractinoplanes durhamensis]|uniref:Uncharacterized protein n=1 Tax=Paractinoplanes durhamensis TaxID=113563 RepID=A0ABQ3YU60_9ACTN|nr:FTR1 family protein [Actinoplanes durhamensis]GIE01108.1 hypothetical protein Adu01nite_24580 [Actinoplanes durhamensis]
MLTYVAKELLSGVRLEVFEAVTSLIAVCMVTWMIFWMRRSARTIKSELTGKRAAISVRSEGFEDAAGRG